MWDRLFACSVLLFVVTVVVGSTLALTVAVSADEELPMNMASSYLINELTEAN